MGYLSPSSGEEQDELYRKNMKVVHDVFHPEKRKSKIKVKTRETRVA